MAKDKKKSNKSMKASKKGKIIAILVCTVLALAAIAYIVYFTGLLPRVIPGMKVTKTVNEQTTVIENISVLEVNYHTRQVMSSYNVSQDMWDQIADQTTGKTYGQYILEIAAEEIKNCVVINNTAAANGYDDHGGARRYAETMLGNATAMTSYYNVTNDQYLAGIYGTGMTSRLFIQCTERMALTSEYESYVQQFVLVPSDEEINASFEESPSSFQRVDFSLKFFPVVTEENATDENPVRTIDECQADANAVVAAVSTIENPDEHDFADAVIALVSEDAPELQGITEDTVPYYYQNYSGAMGYLGQDVTDFLYDQEREAGSIGTVATDNGVYVIFLKDRYVDETPTVTYRSCILYLASNGGDIAQATNTANAFAATTTDSLGFDAFVKENSVYPNEILTGGYYEGITADSFQGTEERTVSAEDTALGQWLFDSSRSNGDMLVQVAADQSMVRVIYFENTVPQWMQTVRLQARAVLQQQWRESLFTEGESYEIAYDLIDRLTYGNS